MDTKAPAIAVLYLFEIADHITTQYHMRADGAPRLTFQAVADYACL